VRDRRGERENMKKERWDKGERERPKVGERNIKKEQGRG
jgi:hypothetical protein